MSVLYITQNGIADHIGQSQVAPYILGLARKGHRIHLLSAEKPGREDIIGRYQRQFDATGIVWSRVRYHAAPKLLGPLWTQWSLERTARQIIAAGDIHAVHCRSYPAALIGRRLKSRHNVKFLYDFRDFYADGGLTKGAKLLRPLYRRMKQLEGPMIRDADRIVCLTNRARDLLIDWYFPSDRCRARR
jgi:glycosyltransferase involved in cell wall biosynthesis